MAEEWGLDVLCVQDTRIPEVGFASVKKVAKDKGWQAHLKAGRRDENGAEQYGMATFSRWPSRRVKLDGAFDQVVAIILDMPGGRPVILYNQYGDVKSQTNRENQTKAILYDLAGHLEDGIIIGDWNETPETNYLAEMLGKGIMEEVDREVGAVIAATAPTRRDWRGDGRHVDYALSSPGLQWKRRGQFHTSSDHDMITYDLSTKGRPESYRRIRATKLDKVEEVTKEEYEASMDRSEYRSQLEEWRTNDAYQVLSRTAEDLLGATERGRRRDIVPEPTRSPAPRTFGMKLMSNTERRLRRLAGQIRQLHKGYNKGDSN
jgi:hypothetical protein